MGGKLFTIVRHKPGTKEEAEKVLCLDAASGREIGRCGTGYGLASIIVWRGEAFVFASRMENDGWHDVPAMALQRFCGAGLEAVNIAAEKIRSGWLA